MRIAVLFAILATHYTVGCDCAGNAVSREPPVVAILTPVEGTAFSVAEQANIAVTGSCSAEGREVVISGDATATVTCTDGAWNASLDFTAAALGVVSIEVNHSSSVGIKAEPAHRTFLKTALPPQGAPGITPMVFDFGPVALGGNSAPHDFVLGNSAATLTGCAAAALTNGADFTITADTCGTAPLALLMTCTLTVRANPTAVGTATTAIVRHCSNGDVPTNTLTVTGALPTLLWSPLSKDFGPVGIAASSAPQTFTFSNSGDVPASGCARPALTNSTDFTVSSDTCGSADVPAHGACTVVVTATPATGGAHATTLARTCTQGTASAPLPIKS